ELDAGATHRHDGVGEERGLAGDDEVARPRQSEAPTDASAVDRSDRRFRQIAPPAAHAQVGLLLEGHDPLAVLLAPVIPPQGDRMAIDVEGRGRARVVSSREVLPGTAQDAD